MEIFFFSEFIMFVSVLLFLMFNLAFEVNSSKFYFAFLSNRLNSTWIEYTVYILAWYFLILYSNDFLIFNDLSLTYLQNDFLLFSKYFLVILFCVFLLFVKWFLSGEDIYKGQELFFFLLIMFLGFLIMLSSKNFVLLFLALECQSFAMYILVALRYKDRFSTEAALKYFLFGAISAILFLISVSYFYFLWGTLDFEVIRLLSFTSIDIISFYEKCILNFSLILLCCSLLVKLGCVPFHFWMPDVYNGTSLIILFLFFLLPKAALIFFMLYLFPVVLQVFYYVWSMIFFVSGILSIIVGSFLALDQWKFKKLLIYSSIVNIGYILLSFSIGGLEVFSMCFFYLFSYIMNVSIVFVTLLLSSRSNVEVKVMGDFFVFAKLYPFLGLYFIFSLLGSGGIPPLLFFYSKIFIIAELIGGNIVSFFTMSFITFLTVISIFYYIRAIRYSFCLVSEKNFINFSTFYSTIYFLYYFIVLFVLFQVVFVILGDEFFLFLFHKTVFFF